MREPLSKFRVAGGWSATRHLLVGKHHHWQHEDALDGTIKSHRLLGLLFRVVSRPSARDMC